MSLLDQLKKQAEEVAAAQFAKATDTAERAAQTEKAMNIVNGYCQELVRQLNVLRPESDRTFPLGAAAAIGNLRMEDFGVIARRRGLLHEDPWNFIHLRFKYANPQALSVSRDVEQIAAFESMLNGCGIGFTVTNQVARYSNKALPAIYEIPQRVSAEVVVTCDPKAAEIVFTCRNIERFTAFGLLFPADSINHALLDEMTKFILGLPNTFRGKGKFLVIAS